MNEITSYTKKYFSERDVLPKTLAGEIAFILKKARSKTVLDVGSGTGKLVEYLRKSGFEAIGCDSSKIAVKKYGAIFAKATNLPFKDDTFDAVLGISLIEHLREEEAEKFIQEASRILKTGGLIFLVTPNYASPWRLISGKRWFGYSDPTHKVFYTSKTLKTMLVKRFTNIKFTFPAKSNLPFDWPVGKSLKKLPLFTQEFLNFLLISTPLAKLRDSLWVSATKNGLKNSKAEKLILDFQTLLLAILFLGTILRIIWVLNFPLFFDEAHQILLSRSDNFIAAVKAAAEGHPPLNLVILRFWQLFSQNLIFVRILPLIFGIFTIAAIALVGRRLFGNSAGLIAAFLVAVSPAQIYYSSIARMYALAIFESVVITYFFIKFFNRKCGVLPLTVVLLIGLYTHFFFIIYFLVFSLFLTIFWPKFKLIFGKFLLLWGLILIFFLPAIILILVSSRSFAVPANTIAKLPFFYAAPIAPWDLILGLDIVQLGKADFLSIVAILLTSVVIMTLFLGVWILRKHKNTQFLSFIYLLTPILMLIFSYIFFRLAAVRSFIIFSPLFFLIIAEALTRLFKKTRFLAFATLSILTLLVFGFLTFYSLGNFGSKDFLKQVYSNFETNDTIVYNDVLFYLPTKLLNLPGNHILIHKGYLEDVGNDAIKALDLKILDFSKLTGLEQRIWYLKKSTNWPSYDLAAQNAEKFLGTNYLEVERTKYNQFELISYISRSPTR